MLKKELESELALWKTEVEKALVYVEKRSYDVEKVKASVSILLDLVGRPNPPSEE